jgi:hypothetical protein
VPGNVFGREGRVMNFYTYLILESIINELQVYKRKESKRERGKGGKGRKDGKKE